MLPAYCKHQFCFGVDDLEQQPYVVICSRPLTLPQTMGCVSKVGKPHLQWSNYQLIFFKKVISPNHCCFFPFLILCPPRSMKPIFAFPSKILVGFHFMMGDSQVLDPVYVIFQHRGSALLCALPVFFSSIRTKARAPRGLTTRRQRMRTERSRSEAAWGNKRDLRILMQDIPVATIDIGILWSQLITVITCLSYYVRATCCIGMKCYEYRRDVLRIITGSSRWVLASAILSTHTHIHL